MSGEVGPFGAEALRYMDYCDVGVPIPLWYPGGTKAPAAKNCTGYLGEFPDRSRVAGWATGRFAGADIGLRLVRGVVGIDLDLYAEAGEFTVGVLQKRWGKLPATWYSTSRDDGSGIYLYRVPGGARVTDLMRDPKGYDRSGGQVFGGLEVVRWCHRFVTCAPSRHPRRGRPEYVWRLPDRFVAAESYFPLLAELPELPEGWCTGLTTGRKTNHVRAQLGSGGHHDWLRATAGGRGDGDLCPAMSRDLARYLGEVEDGGVGGGCYNALRTGVFALVGNAAEGCPGGYLALVDLGRVYIRVMEENGRRGEDRVRTELRSCVVDAVAKRASSPCATEDPCTYRMTG